MDNLWHAITLSDPLCFFQVSCLTCCHLSALAERCAGHVLTSVQLTFKRLSCPVTALQLLAAFGAVGQLLLVFEIVSRDRQQRRDVHRALALALRSTTSQFQRPVTCA